MTSPCARQSASPTPGGDGAPARGRPHRRRIAPRPPSTPLAAAGLIVAVLAGCQQPWGGANEGPAPFEREEWDYHGVPGARLVSEHYVIHTTCRDKPFVDALPTFLEGCWAAYVELLPPAEAPTIGLETYLFQSRWQWEHFTERFTGPRAETYKQIRSGGYSERGVTVSHYDTRRSTLSILAHEGLHQYLEVTHGTAIPAWLNEGLACYFESFDLTSDQRPILDPKKNTLRTPALREAITRGRLQPLEDLLATNAGVEIHKRSVEVLAYYAQAWSTVLFLLEPPSVNPYHDGFRTMLRELGTEAMERKVRAFLAADTEGTMSRGEAIFRAYVTDDFAAFGVRYEDFVRRLLNLAA